MIRFVIYSNCKQFTKMIRKGFLNEQPSQNIEVQTADSDNHQRRVRYNGAILTTNITDPGIRFEKVPDVCVVFISKFDIFSGNRPLYHVDRVVRETQNIVDNGFEEVYVNTKVKDDSEVSELMEVFVNDNAYNSKFPKTSDIKRRYKKTEGGLNTMCEIMEKLRNEAKTEGKLETLFALVADGILTITEAAQRGNISLTQLVMVELLPSKYASSPLAIPCVIFH